MPASFVSAAGCVLALSMVGTLGSATSLLALESGACFGVSVLAFAFLPLLLLLVVDSVLLTALGSQKSSSKKSAVSLFFCLVGFASTEDLGACSSTPVESPLLAVLLILLLPKN